MEIHEKETEGIHKAMLVIYIRKLATEMVEISKRKQKGEIVNNPTNKGRKKQQMMK